MGIVTEAVSHIVRGVIGLSERGVVTRLNVALPDLNLDFAGFPAVAKIGCPAAFHRPDDVAFRLDPGGRFGPHLRREFS